MLVLFCLFRKSHNLYQIILSSRNKGLYHSRIVFQINKQLKY
jgi:hypothetical protein